MNLHACAKFGPDRTAGSDVYTPRRIHTLRRLRQLCAYFIVCFFFFFTNLHTILYWCCSSCWNKFNSIKFNNCMNTINKWTGQVGVYAGQRRRPQSPLRSCIYICWRCVSVHAADPLQLRHDLQSSIWWWVRRCFPCAILDGVISAPPQRNIDVVRLGGSSTATMPRLRQPGHSGRSHDIVHWGA